MPSNLINPPPPAALLQPAAPIGVFDSGIGGLSILKALRAEMPNESFVYFADSAHNPYGEKPEAFVIERSRAITLQLINEHRIKALVVACNTATAAAIHILRAEHPSLPIIGVEPALKPAVAVSQTKRIAVLATRGTLHSAKFQTLLASLQGQAEFICTPCDGLAELIENSIDTPDATNSIAAHACFYWSKAPFGIKKAGIDTLVLGCTHYPLVLPLFRQAVGNAVQIVDNGQAVARRVASLIQEASGAGHNANFAALQFISSDDTPRLQRAAARWL
jgi:glutamate racemase